MAKLPNVTQRVKIIEAAIAKMEGELEDAEGARKAALEKLIEAGQQTLKRLSRHVLH